MRKYNISTHETLTQVFCTNALLKTSSAETPYEIVSKSDNIFKLRIGESTYEGIFIHDKERHEIVLNVAGYHYRLKQVPEAAVSAHAGQQGDMKAVIPGKILKVNLQPGQRVAGGEVAVVLEAMKMEHSLTVKAESVVAEVLVKEGDQVQADQILIRYRKTDDT